jgi:hypothetical protein
VKRLRDKPLTSFEGTDVFLRIAAAAKAGYITYTISMDEDKLRVRREGARAGWGLCCEAACRSAAPYSPRPPANAHAPSSGALLPQSVAPRRPDAAPARSIPPPTTPPRTPNPPLPNALGPHPQNDLILPLAKLYSSALLSDAAQAWNALRAEAVAAAVRGRLLPAVEREAARRLEGEARDVVLAEASDT